MGYREVPVGTESCLGCNAAVEEGTALCTACGAPIDVAQFAEYELKLKPLVRQARGALAGLTIWLTLGALLMVTLDQPVSAVAPAVLGALLFTACWQAVRRRPLLASATALSILAALHIAVVAEGRAWMLFEDSVSLALMVVVFVLLAGGVRAGLRIRDIRRQARPSDRALAGAAVLATLAAGIALGMWARDRDQEPASYEMVGLSASTIDATQE